MAASLIDILELPSFSPDLKTVFVPKFSVTLFIFSTFQGDTSKFVPRRYFCGGSFCFMSLCFHNFS